MKKYKCKNCNLAWFSEDDIEQERCPDDETHTIKEIKQLNAFDYAEIWGQDLENENRHSLTDMPNIILHSLIKHIKDESVIRKIMKDLYNAGIGI